MCRSNTATSSPPTPPKKEKKIGLLRPRKDVYFVDKYLDNLDDI